MIGGPGVVGQVASVLALGVPVPRGLVASLVFATFTVRVFSESRPVSTFPETTEKAPRGTW